jgi:hypothetical protein
MDNADMRKLLPLAMELLKDLPYGSEYTRLEELLKRKRTLFSVLAVMGATDEAASAGEVLTKSDVVPFVRVVGIQGYERVAHALYAYHPDDLWALCALLSYDLRREAETRYFGDILRLIARALYGKDAKLPTITEATTPQKVDNRSSAEIVDGVKDILKKRKERRRKKHEDGTGV